MKYRELEQRAVLLRFESEMDLGPVAAAAKLDTPYATYKAWKSGRTRLPGVAVTAINLWIAIGDKS